MDLSSITKWPAAADIKASRALLRTLLTAWRARLSRTDVGLAAAGTLGGLSRKDVARLAGVSPRWYEMFEQGTSTRRFSSSFVMGVADALRLSRGERAALSRLALPEVAAAVEYFERVNKRRPVDWN